MPICPRSGIGRAKAEVPGDTDAGDVGSRTAPLQTETPAGIRRTITAVLPIMGSAEVTPNGMVLVI